MPRSLALRLARPVLDVLWVKGILQWMTKKIKRTRLIAITQRPFRLRLELRLRLTQSFFARG